MLPVHRSTAVNRQYLNLKVYNLQVMADLSYTKWSSNQQHSGKSKEMTKLNSSKTSTKMYL